MIYKIIRNLAGERSSPPPEEKCRICFHIPASPTNGFYSQAAMFRLALDALGGVYEQAQIVITFGDEEVRPLPDRWSPFLGSTTKVNWVSPEIFHEHQYLAQVDARWYCDYDEYDVVFFCDADTLLIRPLDELLIQTQQSAEVMGVIAHFPFPLDAMANYQQTWLDLARQFVGKPIEFNYRHTLPTNGNLEMASCPFYVNFGFVVMTSEIIKTVRATYLTIRPKLTTFLNNPYFAGQIALTLSLLAHDIPTRDLGMRYNFPNDARADKMYPKDLRDIRLLHYLRTDTFDRQVIFTTEKAFKDFLSLKLRGSNKIFQNHIRKLTHGKYPF